MDIQLNPPRSVLKKLDGALPPYRIVHGGLAIHDRRADLVSSNKATLGAVYGICAHI